MRSFLVSTLLMLASPALAQEEQVLDVELMNKVLQGQGKPYVLLKARRPARRVELLLKRDDGKELRFPVGDLRAGAVKKVPIEQPVGRHHYTGVLRAQLAGAEAREMPLDFDAVIAAPIALEVSREKVDLARHALELKASRPLSKVSVEVTGDSGQSLGSTEVELGATPSDAASIEWRQEEGTVLRIALKGYDADGFYGGLELYPWRVEVPHEELKFASDSSQIESPERPKLDATLKLLSEAVRKYGAVAEVKLYVAGHTDTVGSAEHNRQLSEARARAIGEYLRRKGLRIPVLCQGFGEDALAVATPDDTDEPRNRRAEYILAVEDPFAGRPELRSSWKRLP